MDYKEKYEQALEKMKAWAEGKYPECFAEAQKAAEFIFPELMENEDEKIRKAIIEFFELQDDNTTYSFISKKDILAWLQKQGEKFIPEDINEAALQYVDNCSVDGEVTHDNVIEPYWNNHSMINAYKAGWLEKQGETDGSIKWHDVSEKPEKNRELLCEWQGSDNCIWHDTVFYNPDNEAFWNYGRQVDYVTRWCYVDDIVKRCEQKESPCDRCKRTQPSHSCQDITELGRCYLEHEKQGEHKQLKKVEQEYHCNGVREPKEATGVLKQLLVEQKSNCSEEALQYLREHHSPSKMSDFQAAMNIAVANAYDKGKADAINTMKTEWSEEDENRFEEAIDMIESNGNWVRSEDAVKQISSWLNSLKDKYSWKPNEEQMDCLNSILRFGNVSQTSYKHLNSLINDLKKLKD